MNIIKIGINSILPESIAIIKTILPEDDIDCNSNGVARNAPKYGPLLFIDVKTALNDFSKSKSVEANNAASTNNVIK